MNKKLIIGGGIFIIVIGIFFVFNLKSSGNLTGHVTSSFSESKTFQGDTSKLIFELSELPEGYKIILKGPRVKSDVSSQAIVLGWKEGYQISFAKGDGAIFDTTTISQVISRYPLENISLVLETKEEGYIQEKLSNPNIGDISVASKITEDTFGMGFYRIEFVKKDIYVALTTQGDYELLQDLAIKA